MNYKKYILHPVLGLASSALLLAGCSSSTADTTQQNQTSNSTEQTKPSVSQTQQAASSDTSEENDDDIDIAGIKAGSDIDLAAYDQPIRIESAGTYTLHGTGDQCVVVEAKDANVTLILDNASISGGSLPAIFVRKAQSVTIELKGENSLTNDSTAQYDALNGALYSKSDLTIQGDGSLTIDAGFGHGIKAKDNAVFTSGTYNITSVGDGIHVNDDAQFTGGTYTIDSASEGIESKTSMTISGGTFYIQAMDDGLNAISSMVLSGGTLEVYSQSNDAIDSNGTLEFSGADITAVALKTPEGAFDVDNTPFTISGGSVLGLGTMATTPTSASQPVVLMNLTTKGSVISIVQNGNEVASWNLPQTSGMTGTQSVLTLSCPAFEQGQSYELYVDGNKTEEFTISSSVTTIGSVSSMGGGKGGMMGGQPGTDGTTKRPGRGGFSTEMQPGMDTQSSATAESF